jgi:hypothetical protein
MSSAETRGRSTMWRDAPPIWLGSADFLAHNLSRDQLRGTAKYRVLYQ